MIIEEKHKSGRTYLLYNNKVILGDIEQQEDGFYQFFPANNNRYFPSYTLRLIADYIDNKNKNWNEKIDSYFKQQ